MSERCGSGHNQTNNLAQYIMHKYGWVCVRVCVCVLINTGFNDYLSLSILPVFIAYAMHAIYFPHSLLPQNNEIKISIYVQCYNIQNG